MVNSRVSRQDLDSEMTVVRNEFERGENSPGRILEERVLSTAYLWHAYGRSPIGARSDIEKVPIEALQAFYRKYYQPDNAMLVVAGKFDPDKTLGWINATFGAIPKPTRKLTPTYTEEPTQDGEREVTLRRVGDRADGDDGVSHSRGRASRSRRAGSARGDPGRRALRPSVQGSGGDQESRFRLAPRRTAARSRPLLFTRDCARTAIWTTSKRPCSACIDGVVKEPPSKDEVDRARTRMLKDIDLELNNSGRVGLELSEWASMGDWRLLFLNPRPHREGHARRRGPRGQAYLQSLQPHHRHVHPRRCAGARRNPRHAGCGRDR